MYFNSKAIKSTTTCTYNTQDEILWLCFDLLFIRRLNNVHQLTLYIAHTLFIITCTHIQQYFRYEIADVYNKPGVVEVQYAGISENDVFENIDNDLSKSHSLDCTSGP